MYNMSVEVPIRLLESKSWVPIPLLDAFANWRAPEHQVAVQQQSEKNGGCVELIGTKALSRSPSLVHRFVDKSSKMYSAFAQKVMAAQQEKENHAPSDQPKARIGQQEANTVTGRPESN